MSTIPSALELEQAFEESFEKEPVSYSWGFFAYDDTPGATGGGAGNFSWFDSDEQILAFLQKYPLLLHSSSCTDEALFAKASDCLAKVTTDALDQKVIDKLNEVIAGIEQIQWFGKFSDLLSGETEFATGLRKFFSGSTNAISRSQIPEFGEFLRNWGH